MSGTPGGQGGFHQNQQNFAYNDGNRSVQYQSHQTSWTTHSQQGAPAPVLPAPQPIHQASSMQTMLPAPDIHQQHMQMANQIHAQAMQHHAAVAQSMQQALQPMHHTLPAPPQPVYQQPQIQYAPAPAPVQYQQPPQIGYAPSPAAMQYQQPPQRTPTLQHHQPLQIAAPPQDHISSSESNSSDSSDSEDERKRQTEQMEKRLAARLAANERLASEKLHALQSEVRKLTEVGKQSASKDRKVEALEQQLAHARQEKAEEEKRAARLLREKAEAEQRHSRDLAQAYASATSSQPQTPAIDMSVIRGAIQDAIRDVKSSNLSKGDIASIVDDTVGRRMTGLATTEDMRSAAMVLQKEFKKLPSALSDHQMDTAVQRGFDKAVDKYIKPRPKQQRLEGAPEQVSQPWEQQRPSRARTTFEISELPEEPTHQRHAPSSGQSVSQRAASPPSQAGDAVIRRQQQQQPPYAHGSSDDASRKSSPSKSRALPAPESHTVYPGEAALTNDALARVPGQHGSTSSKSRAPKSRMPVQPSSDNTLARIKKSIPPAWGPSQQTNVPLTGDALARLPAPKESSSKSRHSKSRTSVQPSDDNVLARVKHPTLPSPAPSTRDGSALTESALARLPLPDKRSSKSRHSKSRASAQPSGDTALVHVRHFTTPPPAPSQHGGSPLTEGALAQLPAPSNGSAQGTYSKSIMSVQPTDDNAVSRSKHADAPSSVHMSQPTETALTNAALTRLQHAGTKSTESSKQHTLSIQPAASNAMARLGSTAPSQFQSSVQAIAAAQSSGVRLATYGGHAGIHPELPDDFPDTASQITSWERDQKGSVGSQRGMVDAGTVARRPRNDRRADGGGGSGLRQVTYPEAETVVESQAVVKQGGDVVKGSRR